jgi:hypothetical protein
MKKLLGIAPLLVFVLSCAPATSGIGGGDDDDNNDNNNGSEGEGEAEGDGEGEDEEEFPCGEDCDVCINGECADDGDEDECVELDDEACVGDGLLCDDGFCDVAEVVTCPELVNQATVDPSMLLTDATFEIDDSYECAAGQQGLFLAAFVVSGSGEDVETMAPNTNFEFATQVNVSTPELFALGGCTTNVEGDLVGFFVRDANGESNLVCGEIE